MSGLPRVILLYQEQEKCGNPNPVGQFFELDHPLQLNNYVMYPLTTTSTNVINAMRTTKAIYIPTNILITVNNSKMFTAIPLPNVCNYQIINLSEYGLSPLTSISVITRSSLYVYMFSEPNYRGMCRTGTYDNTFNTTQFPIKSMWIPSGAYVSCQINNVQVTFVSNTQVLNFTQPLTHVVPKVLNVTSVIIINESDQARIYSYNTYGRSRVNTFGKVYTIVVPLGKCVVVFKAGDTTKLMTVAARHHRLTEILATPDNFDIYIFDETDITNSVILYTENNYKGNAFILSDNTQYSSSHVLNLLEHRSIGSISMPTTPPQQITCPSTMPRGSVCNNVRILKIWKQLTSSPEEITQSKEVFNSTIFQMSIEFKAVQRTP